MSRNPVLQSLKSNLDSRNCMTTSGACSMMTRLGATCRNWLSRRDNKYFMPCPPWFVHADTYAELSNTLSLFGSTKFFPGQRNTIWFSRNETIVSGKFTISSDDFIALILEPEYFNAYSISPSADILAPLEKKIRNFDEKVKII